MTSMSIKQRQPGYNQAGAPAAGMKYCWRSRWRGDDGQVWLDSKESRQRRWSMDWFPNMSPFPHTQVGQATLEVSVCSRHARVHLCLSSVSLHLLCVYSESAGGHDVYTVCTGSLNKEWKVFFIAVSSRSFALLAPVGEAQVTWLLKPFLLSKGPLCWPGDWRRGVWGGSRRDKKGRAWVMKMLHVFKSRLAEKRNGAAAEKALISVDKDRQGSLSYTHARACAQAHTNTHRFSVTNICPDCQTCLKS